MHFKIKKKKTPFFFLKFTSPFTNNLFGLGLKDLSEVNQVALARFAWRFLAEHDKLWVQLLQPKYGYLKAFELGKSLVGVSFTWRSVVEGYSLLCSALEWEIGRIGQFWLEKWLGPFHLVDKILQLVAMD